MAAESFDIEFDTWAKLYKDDPAAFELMKKDAIEHQLNKYLEAGKDETQVNRLRAIIWRQEQELNKFKDPLARHNKLIELFFDQNTKFADALRDFTEALNNDKS